MLVFINLFYRPTTAEYLRTEVFLFSLILKYFFVYVYVSVYV